MAQFESGAAAFGQGMQNGAGLMMNLQQAREQKKAKEWERDLSVMTTGLKAAGEKGVRPETRMKVLQGVGNVYQKYYGMNPFEGMSTTDLPKTDEFLKFAKDAMTSAQKDPSKAGFYLGEVVKSATDFRGKFMQDKEGLDAFNALAKGPEDYLGGIVSQQAKQKEQKPDMSPPEAFKRQSQITEKIAGLGKGIVFDDATGKTIDISQNPEAKKQYMRIYADEFNAASEYLPQEKRRRMMLQSEFEPLFESLSPEKKMEAKEKLRSGRWAIGFDK